LQVVVSEQLAVTAHDTPRLVSKRHQTAKHTNADLKFHSRADDERPVSDVLLEHEGVSAVAIAHAQPCLARRWALARWKQVDVIEIGDLDRDVVAKTGADLLLSDLPIALQNKGGVMETVEGIEAVDDA